MEENVCLYVRIYSMLQYLEAQISRPPPAAKPTATPAAHHSNMGPAAASLSYSVCGSICCAWLAGPGANPLEIVATLLRPQVWS